jgi:PAS domain S-box-containing protein
MASAQVDVEALFQGPGSTREALRQKDWASTPLGPVPGWAPELKAAIRTVLPSNIPMLLWWGPELVQIFNEAYRPVLGEKYPAAVGQPGAECWAEIWDEIGPLAQDVLAGKGATYNEQQLLWMRRHGYLEETYWTFSYSPIRNEDGQIAGIFVATTDVTERVLSGRRLETLRQLGRLPIVDTPAEACRTAIMVLAEANPQDLPLLQAYLGGDGGQGDPVLVVSAGDSQPGDAVLSTVAEVMRTGRPEQVSQQLILPLTISGRAEPAGAILTGISPYRELDVAYRSFLSLVADQVSTGLTGSVALEAERQRAKALSELDSAKTTFFSNVSHELRTPLTLITGPLAESLDDTAHPLPAGHRDRLEAAQRNSLRLQRLVNNILDFVSIEGGHLVALRAPENLGQITLGVAESFTFAMRRAGLRFVLDVADLPHLANVDHDMWEKIVANLLSNALKFTLTGEVRLSLSGDEQGVTLSVSDTGAGIPEDQQHLLFQRFHRVRVSAARSQEGTGIGLALVYELTRLHGGTIEVDSTEGTGSTFTVKIPYGTSDSPSTTVRAAAPLIVEEANWQPVSPARPASAHPATVLVVDDNPDMRGYLTRLLEPYWRVTLAANGQEALAAIAVGAPDLVLTDVMMPKVDGFDLLHALRAEPRTATIPVIMLSARAGESAAVQGFQAGADDYLAKPFSSRELIARVRAHLELAMMRNHESAWRAALIGSMQDAFVLGDSAGNLIEVNDAFRELVGLPLTDFPLSPPFPWWPAETPEQETLNAAGASARATGHGRSTLPLRHADGHRIWADAVYSSVIDPATGERVYVGTLRDVTANMLAQQRKADLAQLSGRLSAATDVDEVLLAGASTLGALIGTTEAVAVVAGPDGEPESVAGHAPIAERALRALAGTAPGALYVSPGSIGMRLAGDAVAVLWARLPVPRPPSQADQDQVQLLGGMVAQALSRERSSAEQRDVALTLQRAMLSPHDLPAGFAARYEPAVTPLEVGGDWYDVVLLDDGRAGLVVGDCVGRGLAAAAVMGQLRSACRALLMQDNGPAEVLRVLDRFAEKLPGALCTTLFCATVDQATGELCYASAGHPPGIVRHPGGERVLLEQAQTVPLAATANPVRLQAQVLLRPGSTLLLYSDGLVERRDHPLSVGIARVGQALDERAADPVGVIADHVIAAARPTSGQRDDVALLVYRHQQRALRQVFPARASELAGMRAGVRDWLDGNNVSHEVINRLIIALGEAGANAVEHAFRDAEPGQVTVLGQLHDDRVEITISDTGVWKPPQQSLDRGRGLQLMRAMTDKVTVVHPGTGTTLRLVKYFSS